jgi:hypothetical protein
MSLIFNVFGGLAFFSPPFLAFFVWKKFLQSPRTMQRPRWKAAVEWTAILCVSSLFVICIIAFLTIPCDVDRFGWSCVAKWRTFTRLVVQAAPAFLLLAILGRKGTRILSILWIIAMNFDCLMVDLMA